LAYEHEKYAKYNYWSSFSNTEDIPENYANISYQVADNEGKTTLILTQDGFKNQEAMAHSEANWIAMMDEMKKLIE
jgi:Activator of Hsp90 ATPase homolog 1-like protein